jgi:predicted RNase H-like nuclease (RuvC/YqgF family)
MNWIEIVGGLVSGGVLQHIVSSKMMPKKEKKEADAEFIDKLMERINILEARIDNQTVMIKELLVENSRMKAELEYLRKSTSTGLDTFNDN